MVVVLDAVQLERLEKCRAVFNKLTGSRFSLKKYIHFCVEQCIVDQEASADAAQQFVGEIQNFMGEGGFSVTKH